MNLNPHLKSMTGDYLYHLNIDIKKGDNTIKQQFGDVRVVCMGGTGKRMKELAEYVRSLIDPQNHEELVDLTASGGRYAMYKVGPVLCCSHGIGMASMSVVVHELIKLLHYAECKDPVLLRVGTCGGVSVEAGTVIVSDKAFNGALEENHEIFVLGERVNRPTGYAEDVIAELLECGKLETRFPTVRGNTLAAECFYEGQGRIDGASCDYTDADKMVFLQKCAKLGIRNIEMEATMFSSLTRKTGVRAGSVCVALLNRLNGDQVNITPEQKADYEFRPLIIVGHFIKRLLQ